MRTLTPDTRQRILDAAAKLFAAQRFHEVRMDDVAVAADVAKGTLYRYFRDKEELYRDLVSSAASQIWQVVDERAAAAETPQARIVAMLEGSWAFFESHPYLSDLLQRVEVMNPSDAMVAWNEIRHQFAERISALLSDPSLAVADPDYGALMLLGALRQLHRFGKRPLPDDIVERVVASYLFGAAASRSSAT